MITKLINEKFLTSSNIDYLGHQENFNFFMNPSNSELSSLNNSCRGIIDKAGNLFVWDSKLVHEVGIRYLKLKGFGNDVYYDRISSYGFPIEITGINVVLGESTFLDNVKDKKEMIIDMMKKCKIKNSNLNFYCSRNINRIYLVQ